MIEAEFLHQLHRHPFLGILRGVQASHLKDIARVSAHAGVRFLEVTMNTTAAPELIRELSSYCEPLGIVVGAGTVCSEVDLDEAQQAGAKFIVSPGLFPNVIRAAKQYSLPTIPGALTPSEIYQAYTLGASCVKVFPIAAMGGASYVKELRGPFAEIPLLACGGVNAENCADYFAAGVDSVAFGASIFKPDWMQNGQWDLVQQALVALVNSKGC